MLCVCVYAEDCARACSIQIYSKQFYSNRKKLIRGTYQLLQHQQQQLKQQHCLIKVPSPHVWPVNSYIYASGCVSVCVCVLVNLRLFLPISANVSQQFRLTNSTSYRGGILCELPSKLCYFPYVCVCVRALIVSLYQSVCVCPRVYAQGGSSLVIMSNFIAFSHAPRRGTFYDACLCCCRIDFCFCANCVCP